MESGDVPAGDWVEVFVPHLPAPQGSHRQGFGKSVRESNPKTDIFRQAVADACERELEGWHCTPFDEPVEAEFVFHLMPVPKGDPTREFHFTPPDVDKLLRAAFDGLTRGRMWKDDARCSRVVMEKVHAATEEDTGCTIRVRPRRSRRPASGGPVPSGSPRPTSSTRRTTP